MISVQAQGADFLIYEDKDTRQYYITSPIPKFFSRLEGKDKPAMGLLDKERYRVVATIQEGQWFQVDQ